MHKIKKWMLNNDWFEENHNQEIRTFIFHDFKFEDPVYQHNKKNAIQLDFSQISIKKRFHFIVNLLHQLLDNKEIYLCEYGCIGIADKVKLIKGKPNKENCIEFDSFNDDIDYLYDNITYIRVDPNNFNIKYFVKKFFKKHFNTNYYIIDLVDMMGIRLYDERGGVIVAKDTAILKRVSEKYSKYVTLEFVV